MKSNYIEQAFFFVFEREKSLIEKRRGVKALGLFGFGAALVKVGVKFARERVELLLEQFGIEIEFFV